MKASDLMVDEQIDKFNFFSLVESFDASQYSYHPEDHYPKLKHLVKHVIELSAFGGGMEGLARSLTTPDPIYGAQLVLYKLAQKAGHD